MLLSERSSGSLSSSLVNVVADWSPWFCITRFLSARISLSCRASTDIRSWIPERSEPEQRRQRERGHYYWRTPSVVIILLVVLLNCCPYMYGVCYSPAETSTTAVKRLISSALSRSAANFSLNSHMELRSSPAPNERSVSRL